MDRRSAIRLGAGASVAAFGAGLSSLPGAAAMEGGSRGGQVGLSTAARELLHHEGDDLLLRRAPWPIDFLAVEWEGEAGVIDVGWTGGPAVGAVSPLRGCDPGTEAGRHRVLVPAPAATGYRLDVRGDVSLVAVSAYNRTRGQRLGPLSNTGTSASRWGAEVDAPTDEILGSLTYLSRAGWGADESLRLDEDGKEKLAQSYFPTQKLTVHHTATSNGDPDPAGTVRAIYADHVGPRDFGDIGYQLLIDERGVVYEGRYSGDDGMPVFGDGADENGRPTMSTGAHVAGWNSGNIGVALLGDFTRQPPTDAARSSLVVVLAVLSQITSIDPLGSETYLNPVNGTSIDVDNIPGHRDFGPTECPGDAFYLDLPGLRRDVAQLLTGTQ
ncbi:MAG: N-acetylmuramoyl-L-alanine amidase [Nocardioides sp.]